MSHWMAEAADTLSQMEPALWNTLYPRRILPPAGFENPRNYAVAMFGHLKMWEDSRLREEPHMHMLMSTLSLIHHLSPTYFVLDAFARSVAATRAPSGLKFGDIRRPLDSMLLVLPDSFTKDYFGYRIPFVTLTAMTPGVYPEQFQPATRFEHIPRGISLKVPVNHFLVTFHAYAGMHASTPTEYTSNYPMTSWTYAALDAPFKDATIAESILFGNRLNMEAMTPEKDRALVTKVTDFMVRLLLILTATPRTLQHGVLARPAKMKKGLPQEALWHPNLIGVGFSRSWEGGGGGGSKTGSSVRPHMRWGHLTHQVVGKRTEDFVSVRQLPHKTDGTVDWEQVPEETRVQFWKNHDLRWIEPVLVGADTLNTTQPKP